MNYGKCKHCGRYMKGVGLTKCGYCGTPQHLTSYEHITNVAVTITAIIFVVAALFFTQPMMEGFTDSSFDRAVALLEECKYEEALDLFLNLQGKRDCDAYIAQCEEGIRADTYAKALALMQEDKMEEAMYLFQELGDYKDSQQLLSECEISIKDVTYMTAVGLARNKQYFQALSKFVRLGNYKESYSYIARINYAMASGIAVGDNHTVGLLTDGSMVATGKEKQGQCDVYGWDYKNVVAIAAGGDFTAVLHNSGYVSCTSGSMAMHDDEGWYDIVAIAAGSNFVIGLRVDGTVVAEYDGNTYGACDVSDWTDIVAIAAGEYHTVGLKADGTVVATGWNINGRCNVSKWTDIVAISTNQKATLGLKADGTVVGAGITISGDCENIVHLSGSYCINRDGTMLNHKGEVVSNNWIAVAEGKNHTVYLHKRGTASADSGWDWYDARDVEYWCDLKTPDAFWITD